MRGKLFKFNFCFSFSLYSIGKREWKSALRGALENLGPFENTEKGNKLGFGINEPSKYMVKEIEGRF